MMKKTLIVIGLLIASLSYSQTHQLWGTTFLGGTYTGGTIFNTDINGDNFEVQEMLKSIDGKNPWAKPMEASNGKIYGTTNYGGINYKGIIYEYDLSTGEKLKMCDFDDSSGNLVYGPLLEADNGKLYGMTYQGGANNFGTIFELDLSTHQLTKLYDFDDVNGKNPKSGLMQATNGKLYGTTVNGGASGLGVFFEYDITTNTYTKLNEFTDQPEGSLLEISPNVLLGTLPTGGSVNAGSIFEYDIVAGTFVERYEFPNYVDGRLPIGDLSIISNGKIYGMTKWGGINDNGVIYEYDYANNTYTKLFDFDDTVSGKEPKGDLVEGAVNKIYGSTLLGGANALGVAFVFDITTGTFTKLLDFDNSVDYGKSLGEGFMYHSNGNLYCTPSAGGLSSVGLMLSLDTLTNVLTKVFDFDNSIDGAKLLGSLIQADNGLLYGLAYVGGVYGKGVLYEYDPITKVYTNKFEFGNGQGVNPDGQLMQANNGKLYGVTKYGGANNGGVLFEFDITTDSYTKLLDFDATSGTNPEKGLMQASNGLLYGSASSGGANNRGTFYKYDIATNTITAFFDFTASLQDGIGLFVEDDSQNLYINILGGQGGIVKVDLATETPTIIHYFTSSVPENGYTPQGSILLADNGKLYGNTKSGGLNGDGVVFEYDIINNILTPLVQFDGNNGRAPEGSIIQASTGKLYGITRYGGTNDIGVIYEYDLSTSSYTKKMDMDAAITGGQPYLSNLTEVVVCIENGSSFSTSACDSYTVPSGNNTYTTVGNYIVMDTLVNDCGLDSVLTINLTLGESTSTTDIQTACDSYTWIDGNTYMSSTNTPSITYTSVSGCDSVITLDLTINYSEASTDIQTACNSYTWIDGIEYTSSTNTPTYTLTTVNGCDSVVTLDLTINTVDASVTSNNETVTANAVGATYQWLDCDNNFAVISGETSQSYTATTTGNYAVEVIENSCTDTSVCVNIIVTAVNELAKSSEISIYPNPTQNIVNIDFAGLQNVDLTISDITGKTVYQKTDINESVYSFEFTEKTGVYFIQIKSNEYVQVYKLIKN